jgi:hypothetical protein
MVLVVISEWVVEVKVEEVVASERGFAGVVGVD